VYIHHKIIFSWHFFFTFRQLLNLDKNGDNDLINDFLKVRGSPVVVFETLGSFNSLICNLTQSEPRFEVGVYPLYKYLKSSYCFGWRLSVESYYFIPNIGDVASCLADDKFRIMIICPNKCQMSFLKEM
jgi:hypothetical protein